MFDKVMLGLIASFKSRIYNLQFKINQCRMIPTKIQFVVCVLI